MEENKLAIQNELAIEDIKNLIYTIRGKQVMIDSDVANIYHCETKYVNRVVKRNIERFPEEFCFQLNENEFEVLRCQFVTLNKNGRGQHRKYLPYVFTEQGISMLSGVLKNEIAVRVSVSIMKAFIEMRKFLMINEQVIEDRLRTMNRLEARDRLKTSEKLLSKNIFERGVDEVGFARIRSKGDEAFVRNMLGKRGIKPENLKPDEDIKKLERRVNTENKKIPDANKLPSLG